MDKFDIYMYNQQFKMHACFSSQPSLLQHHETLIRSHVCQVLFLVWCKRPVNLESNFQSCVFIFGGGGVLLFRSWIRPLKSKLHHVKSLCGKEFIHGFCSCSWTDGHMGCHRKFGGKAQEDTPSAPRLWAAGASSVGIIIQMYKSHTCIYEK